MGRRHQKFDFFSEISWHANSISATTITKNSSITKGLNRQYLSWFKFFHNHVIRLAGAIKTVTVWRSQSSLSVPDFFNFWISETIWFIPSIKMSTENFLHIKEEFFLVPWCQVTDWPKKPSDENTDQCSRFSNFVFHVCFHVSPKPMSQLTTFLVQKAFRYFFWKLWLAWKTRQAEFAKNAVNIFVLSLLIFYSFRSQKKTFYTAVCRRLIFHTVIFL